MDQQYKTLRTQTIPQVKEQTILAEVTAIELMLHLVEHVPVLLGRHHNGGRPARLKSHGTGANMCQQNLMAADTDTPDGMPGVQRVLEVLAHQQRTRPSSTFKTTCHCWILLDKAVLDPSRACFARRSGHAAARTLSELNNG